jgi:hypothetical protein
MKFKDALQVMDEERKAWRPAESNPVPSLSPAVSDPPRPGAVDLKARTVEFAFSSDAPVLLDEGVVERLNHSEGCMQEGLLSTGKFPLLRAHFFHERLGVIISHRVCGNRGWAVARINRSPEGDEYLDELEKGLWAGVSVRYLRHSITALGADEHGVQQMRVDSWTPVEISASESPLDIRCRVFV